jgi:hypothetical protein
MWRDRVRTASVMIWIRTRRGSHALLPVDPLQHGAGRDGEGILAILADDGGGIVHGFADGQGHGAEG